MDITTPEIAYPFQLTFQKAACCAFLPQLTLHGVELQFQHTSRHILLLTEGEQSTFSSQSNTIQTLHNRLKVEDTTGFNKIMPRFFTATTGCSSLWFWSAKTDLRPSLWDKTLPHYSQLAFTSFTPLLKQMRGRTGLGYSCSSLRLDFYDIKHVLSVLLNCSPQSTRTKSWLFLLPSTFRTRTVDTKQCCSLTFAHPTSSRHKKLTYMHASQ